MPLTAKGHILSPNSHRKEFCGEEGEGDRAEDEVARRQRHDEWRRHVVSRPAKFRALRGATYRSKFETISTLNVVMPYLTLNS